MWSANKMLFLTLCNFIFAIEVLYLFLHIIPLVYTLITLKEL